MDENSRHNIVILSNKDDLIDCILSNDIIVGMESMALVVALLSEKNVYSAIPPTGRACILPHKEIIHLSRLSTQTL